MSITPPAARGSFKKPPLDPTKFLFFLFFLLQTVLSGQAAVKSAVKLEYPNWRSYTNSNYIKSLVIDHNILWAASGGVIKYNLDDGTYVKLFKEHGLAGNNVLELAIHNRYLWIATASGITRCHIKKNTLKSFYMTDGLPDDAITAITIDDDHNSIWFGTWEGYLFSFNMTNEKWHFLPPGTTIPDTLITSMVVDKNPGLILIGTWGKGLYSYQPDSQLFLKKTLPIKPGINHKSFDCISALFLEHHNQIKKLWLGTVNNGLWIIDYTSGPPIPSKVLDIPDDWITDIKASPNLEQVFVTTRENGMYIYTTLSDQWEKISTATYPNLPGNHLNTCVVNPANKDDIFIGSEGEGIIQLNVKKGTFNTLKFSNEIPNNKVSVITPNEKNHHIWIGTEGNGAGRLDLLENKWTVLNTANNILNSDVVNCISIDHESAWIGTDNGLARFNYQNGKLRSYGIKDGLSSLMIYASTYDPYFPGPKPWITFYYGCPAIFDYDMDKWRQLETIPSIVCYELCTDAGNNNPTVWMAATSGVIHYDLKSKHTINYWPDTEFRSILVDAKRKAIWAGSWEKGLFHMDIETQFQEKVVEFQNLSVLDIKKDIQTDTIWFATSGGVYSLDARGYKRNGRGYTFTHFDAADGLGMNYVLAIGITGDSTWFGTWGGGMSRLLK